MISERFETLFICMVVWPTVVAFQKICVDCLFLQKTEDRRLPGVQWGEQAIS